MKKTNYQYILNIKKLERKPLIAKGLKLCEEVGELASELLKFKNYKKSTELKRDIKQKILLESSDILYILYSVLAEVGFSEKEIEHALLNKIKEREKTYRSRK